MWFSVLGPVEARDDEGRPLDIGTRRQRALLAMLLLDAGRVVGTDALVAGLWGDAAPARAAASIQSYVSNLRRVLEPDRAPRTPAQVLVSRGTGYLVRVGPDELDVRRFEASVADASASRDPVVALGHLDAALALWRGRALAEFTSEPFAAAEAARLEERRASAEEERVDVLLRTGDVESAAADARRLVELAPLRERRQRQLMTALYRAGRQADALDAHRRYVDRLADEFGLDPSPELRRLHAEILRHEVADPAASSRRPTAADTATGGTVPSSETRLTVGTSALPHRPTIVGRAEELRHVDETLTRAVEGNGSVILVAGEAGIGKTRTVEEALQRGLQLGMLTAVGRCFEGGGAPAFWPFVEIGRALADQVASPTERAAVDRLLAVTRPAAAAALDAEARVAHLVDPTTRFLVADEIADALTTLARSRPAVIAVDDAYGADPDSLDALLRVAADGDRVPLVVVVTVRTTDLPVGHPLATALGGLSRLPHLTRIDLAGLELDETRELVEATTGTSVDDTTIGRLHRRTDGNPFFTVEAARLLAGHGRERAGAVPAGVRDVVRLRLGALPPTTQEVLQLAAVVGRSFSREVLAAILGRSELTVLEDMEPATVEQLVEAAGAPGEHRFCHVLIQEAIAEVLPAARRARDHQAVAEVLAPRALAHPELWVEVAHHAVEAVPAAGVPAAIDALSRAAVHAVSVDAHEFAQQLIEQRTTMLDREPPGPDRDAAELRAQLDLCAVLPITSGWHDPALERASSRVIELGRRIGDDDAVTRALSARSANSTVRGDYRSSLATYEEQRRIHRRTGDPAHEFLGHHGAAMAHLFRGELGRAGEVYRAAETLVPILDPDEDGRLRIPPDRMSATAHHASLWALQLWLSGDAVGSRRQRDRARAVAVRVGHPQTIWTVALSHVLGGYAALDVDRVLEGDRWRRSEAGELRSPLVDDLIGVPVGWATVASGEPSAVATLRSRIDSLTARGALVFGALYRAALADACLRCDRVDEAAAALAEAGELAERTGERWWDAEIARLGAVVHHRYGRDAEVAAALATARTIAAAQGAVPLLERVEATAGDVGMTASA